jgi:hypothetical protein
MIEVEINSRKYFTPESIYQRKLYYRVGLGSGKRNFFSSPSEKVHTKKALTGLEQLFFARGKVPLG